MNRPENIISYESLDLKLGIKSSLPHVKSTLALAILLWECADHPSELIYSTQNGNDISLASNIETWLIDYSEDICAEEGISRNELLSCVNQNQLFKSQMEALIVAFELVWKLAKVTFVDEGRPASAERTGGIRYPKKLSYSLNADIIHSVISSDYPAYNRVLLLWLGCNIHCDHEDELRLMQLLTALSEDAVFKLTDGSNDVVFNQNSIYRKILETNEPVDVNGDKEAKGSLRILKSLLSEGINPYLVSNSSGVSLAEQSNELVEDYQKRVETYLRLSAKKDIDPETQGMSADELEKARLTDGTNILLYGVPGSGKSWTISNEYCIFENEEEAEFHTERLVFHPDFMYSDFIGQILPVVKNDRVVYEFTPGPFTKIVKKAYSHPTEMFYLVIEEINRGNAPAIFGDIFQLLDRIKEEDKVYPKGTSEYPVSNENIAKEVYGNKDRKVRIPSNLSIIATMNTSDQNVFTLDNAFQRRWHMRMIPNTFDKHPYAEQPILDTDVSWKSFCEVINVEILKRGSIASSEDKRLGAYFVALGDLLWNDKESTASIGSKEYISAKHDNAHFAEKVLKYLWDDAFKFDHPEVFAKTLNDKPVNSLEDIVNAFSSNKGNKRFDIFDGDIRDALLETVEKETLQTNEPTLAFVNSSTETNQESTGGETSN